LFKCGLFDQNIKLYLTLEKNLQLLSQDLDPDQESDPNPHSSKRLDPDPHIGNECGSETLITGTGTDVMKSISVPMS
jgi:hypothetical protein